MPLSTGHPFRVEGPSFYTHGGLQTRNGHVERGLVSYVSANLYTTTAIWSNLVLGSNRVGSGWNFTGTPFLTNTPGGMVAIDVETTFGNSRAVCELSDTSLAALPTLSVDIWLMRKASSTYYLFREYRINQISGSTSNRSTVYFSNSTLFISGSPGGLRADNQENNRWNHICAVWSPTGVFGYMNGVMFGSDTRAQTRTTDTWYRYILAPIPGIPLNQQSSYHQGIVSTIKVYNVALDASEVKQNYNALAEAHGRLTIA